MHKTGKSAKRTKNKKITAKKHKEIPKKIKQPIDKYKMI
jgi:hypothetical protein